MRQMSAILIAVLLALSAAAQDTSAYTTSGGLTVSVPDGYLVAEIAPLRVGLTAPETGASLLISIPADATDSAGLLASELRRLGISAEQTQPGALNASTTNARISGARAALASGSVIVAVATFNDGSLALLTMRPADSVPLPILKSVVESIRFTPAARPPRFPVCGSPQLPQTITTSGGLSVCFPDGFAAEEKGASAVGIANLADGVILSLYARGDLQTLAPGQFADPSEAARAFAESLRAGGASVFASALETFPLDNGPAASIPVAYPSVGSGRAIAVDVGGEIAVLSAVLLGTPPSDIVATLYAVASSVTIGEGSSGLGAVRPADRVVTLAGASFTTVAGWTLIDSDSGSASLERLEASALMSVAAAPVDSSWNADFYKSNVLFAAAQFAGDTAYDPTAVELVAQEAGVFTLEAYDSSLRLPQGTAAVNLTLLMTLADRAMIVFQATVPRTVYSPAIRDEVIQMALSAR